MVYACAMSVTYTRRAPDPTDAREHVVAIGDPEAVDEFGRRLHRVLLFELENNDGLDRSLTRSGLVIHSTVPYGNNGPEVWFAEAPRATPAAEVIRADQPDPRGGGAERAGRAPRARAGQAARGGRGR